MTINCEAFFPATQKKLIQLLKIIEMSYENDLINSIVKFLKQAELDALEEKDLISKEFWNQHQKICDLKHLIDDGRFPNGIPLNAVQLKTANKDLKEQKKAVTSLERQAKNLNRKIKKLKENQEYIRVRKGVPGND